MLTVVEKVIILQKIDVFAGVPTEQLQYLAAIAVEVRFDEGSIIFREGDSSDALYLVLHGRVRLTQQGREIMHAGEHEVFGTWALFDDEPRLVDATVTDDCRLLRIDRDDFIDLLADHVQITEAVLNTVVKRLRGLARRIGGEQGGSGNRP